MSFQDYTYFPEPRAHETDVRMSGRFEDRTRLLYPFDEFPEVPKCVAGIKTPLVLAVRCPRVAYYFVAVVETQDYSVKKRYVTSYVLEWAHAVAASMTAEHVVHNRVWVCEERCDEFLRKFELLDDFVVDVVRDRFGVVRGLVSLLTKARGLSKPFLQIWVDYPSATLVSWAILRPGSSEFVLPGLRSSVRGGAMGRSSLDVVVPDAGLGIASSWKMAVSGGELRESGWTVRNILDVLAGRVKRYYSFKADAQDELDTARGEIEVLTSMNANLREENGELRRRAAADPLVKRRRGNDGIGSGREL